MAKDRPRLDHYERVAEVWAQLGRPQGVLEAFVPFTKEISVICARHADGQMLCFGPTENEHARHILDVTTVPAGLSPTTARQAVDTGVGYHRNLASRRPAGGGDVRGRRRVAGQRAGAATAQLGPLFPGCLCDEPIRAAIAGCVWTAVR